MPNQPKKISTDIEQIETGHFRITGRLDFETVPAVWRKSQGLFGECKSLDIDLSDVEHSSSAALALLIEWMRNAKMNKQSIRFHNLPRQMQEIAKLCGVEKDLLVQ